MSSSPPSKPSAVAAGDIDINDDNDSMSEHNNNSDYNSNNNNSDNNNNNNNNNNSDNNNNNNNNNRSMVLDLVFEKLITSLSTDVAFRMHRMIKTGMYPGSELYVPKSRSDIYPEIYQHKNVEAECKRDAVYEPHRKKRKTLEEQRQEALNFFGKDYLAESAKETAAATAAAQLAAAICNGKEAATVSTTVNSAGGTETASNIPKGNATGMATSGSSAANVSSGVHMGKQPPSAQLHQHVSQSYPLHQPSSSVAPSLLSQQPQPQPTMAAAAVPPPHPQQYNNHHLDIWGRAPPKEPKDMVDCMICGRQVNTLRYAPHLDKCMGIGTTVRAAALAASGFVPQQSGTTGNVNKK